ncbi:MAG: bacteriophage Gp15 family protein [bacterium]|nr:bacteriophage Gp15 family protein [bacterium]
MFNILLDPLPDSWNGYPIDTDFQTGILISQCLEDPDLSSREKVYTALGMLFPDEKNRPPLEEAQKALVWWMSEFDHDNHEGQKGGKRVIDFDVDQWRIYAAFLAQYHIDLNSTKLHWFTFMGLWANLEECSFSRVVDIRKRKITGKMSREERAYLKEAKKIYGLESVQEQLSEEQKARQAEALEEFNRLRGF